MKGTHLARRERREIKEYIDRGHSNRAISRMLSRGAGTINDEINNNGGREQYDPDRAHTKSRTKKKNAQFQRFKIEHNKELKEYIIERLKMKWNPDEISGRMKLEKQPFYASKTAIYGWLRSVWGQKYCKYLVSKRACVKKHKEQHLNKGQVVAPHIPNRVAISERSVGANNRTRYGHTETDTVVGRKGTPGGIKTLIERKSRYLQAQLVSSMRPQEHADVLHGMQQHMTMQSVTFDNGLENIYHEQSSVPSYFCTPYSSWEKGAIEHANWMLRKTFPKGTDFSQITQTELDEAVDLINKKPRRSNGYRSAEELAQKAGIIRGECSG